MSIEKIVQFNPKNKDHLKMVKQYATEKQISLPMDKILNNDSQDNDYGIYLFIECNNKIKDICYLQCTKDIKACNISHEKNSLNSKKILVYATEYALNNLGMESVFIKIDPTDDTTRNYLSKLNYEDQMCHYR